MNVHHDPRLWPRDPRRHCSRSSYPLSIGLGGDANTRVQVARLLWNFRAQRTFNPFTVTNMHGAGLLVTIEPPRQIVCDDEGNEELIMNNTSTPPEGYWRMDLLIDRYIAC